MRELCIEKGLFTAEQHRVFTEYAEQIGPTPAARLVAKAWLDPEFKEAGSDRRHGREQEVGVDWLDPTGFGTPSDFYAFKILEDTPQVHHVIVCALCSCYPRPILGNSPGGTAPRTIAAASCAGRDRCSPEFGLELPEGVEVRVRTPTRSTGSWSCRCAGGHRGVERDQLTEIITRDCLIGVALPKPGVTTNVFTGRAQRSAPCSRPMSDAQEFPVLDEIVENNQSWPVMAAKYGVENPLPPWKTSLDGLCDVLDRSCAGDEEPA